MLWHQMLVGLYMPSRVQGCKKTFGSILCFFKTAGYGRGGSI
jgi:hypothetical protein